jgi:hypothetical protein
VPSRISFKAIKSHAIRLLPHRARLVKPPHWKRIAVIFLPTAALRNTCSFHVRTVAAAAISDAAVFLPKVAAATRLRLGARAGLTSLAPASNRTTPLPIRKNAEESARRDA